jgi:hypothetical protein
MTYEDFLDRKTHLGSDGGFDPVWMPDNLFPFQEDCVTWACRKGRAALFEDCGLGKTAQQLAWAENAARVSDGRVLILTPLAVAFQTVKEGEKFGVEVTHRRDGLHKGDRIIVTNYERLHHFRPEDFAAVVCDESSILKHYTGATQKAVTRFLTKMPYRLLCTATAAPNDYVELGTSTEALGGLTHSEMLTRFFTQCDDKKQKKEARQQRFAEKAGQYYGKLAFRVAQTIGQWRLKHHATLDFWRWVCSWARACRKPSDLGFADDGFLLPPMYEHQHIVAPATPPPGFLFSVAAFGLAEEREERKRTLDERCRLVADLVNHDRPAVVWCHANAEGDLLESLIPGARQIAGRTPDEEKLDSYRGFADGSVRVLVIKPKIGAWGLNWQHCHDVVTFASHSYEQYYQSVRRCWRFGQQNPVTVHIVASEGEARVMENMKRKEAQAAHMFDMLVREMGQANAAKRINTYTKKEEVPEWL